MPIQVHDALVRATSGCERSRVRTEFRLRLPEPIDQRPLESRSRHCYAIKFRASTPLVGFGVNQELVLEGFVCFVNFFSRPRQG
jgi:hypothetical protein